MSTSHDHLHYWPRVMRKWISSLLCSILHTNYKLVRSRVQAHQGMVWLDQFCNIQMQLQGASMNILTLLNLELQSLLLSPGLPKYYQGDDENDYRQHRRRSTCCNHCQSTFTAVRDEFWNKFTVDALRSHVHKSWK